MTWTIYSRLQPATSLSNKNRQKFPIQYLEVSTARVIQNKFCIQIFHFPAAFLYFFNSIKESIFVYCIFLTAICYSVSMSQAFLLLIQEIKVRLRKNIKVYFCRIDSWPLFAIATLLKTILSLYHKPLFHIVKKKMITF